MTLSDDGAGFAVTGRFADALSGEGDNLVTRAADAFAATFDAAVTGRITLDKRLPVASGLGGGSADAAAMLRLLARRHGVALDDLALFAIADRLGADVPACLFNRTALGTGRGERLAPIAGATGMPVLLVNPGIAVSTAQVFAYWDGVDRGALPDDGTLIDRAVAGRNDLFEPACRLAPAIATLVEWLAAQPGCTLARMSGSGATCFGLFDSVGQRQAAAGRLAGDQPGYWCLETVLS